MPHCITAATHALLHPARANAPIPQPLHLNFNRHNRITRVNFSHVTYHPRPQRAACSCAVATKVERQMNSVANTQRLGVGGGIGWRCEGEEGEEGEEREDNDEGEGGEGTRA